MINHMNKHINRLSLDTVLGIEQSEHGLKNKPRVSELQSIEMGEHGLSKKPTLRQMLKIETKEHVKSKDEEDDDEEENDDEEEPKPNAPQYVGMGKLIIGRSR